MNINILNSVDKVNNWLIKLEEVVDNSNVMRKELQSICDYFNDIIANEAIILSILISDDINQKLNSIHKLFQEFKNKGIHRFDIIKSIVHLSLKGYVLWENPSLQWNINSRKLGNEFYQTGFIANPHIFFSLYLDEPFSRPENSYGLINMLPAIDYSHYKLFFKELLHKESEKLFHKLNLVIPSNGLSELEY